MSLSFLALLTSENQEKRLYFATLTPCLNDHLQGRNQAQDYVFLNYLGLIFSSFTASVKAEKKKESLHGTKAR